ncbi:elongation factor TU GTP binding domain-containing protein [Cryptosporidium andersoni]|uniref:Elongation factor TU GTP binding domain-containing protein n=1 Tax=Cryptosporidium andersoni TaxID=117008 RepID=A0A1J4MSK5_9CRYT|nr:elongation factor TU GTP binding domain-containing protein [Cryptosporidium andersoni]
MVRNKSRHICIDEDDFYDYEDEISFSEYDSEGSEHDLKSSKFPISQNKVKDQDKSLKITKKSHLSQVKEKSNQGNVITNISEPPLMKVKSTIRTLPNYNIVVVGHVDAGKSTLMGHLFVKLGLIDESVIRKYKRESNLIGKGSFAYAWIFDECDDERRRGVTINVCSKSFEVDDCIVTIFDTPGHKDFIPSTYTATILAESAILVIDCDNFDQRFTKGLIKEHLLFIISANLLNLIVVINKMDLRNWDIQIYNNIKQKISDFIANINFCKIKNTCFIPVSALYGINIIEQITQDQNSASWYKGPCIYQILENIAKLKIHESKMIQDNREKCQCFKDNNYTEFIACITDIISSSSNETKISIIINSGILNIGDNLSVLPINTTIKCKSIILGNGKHVTACKGPIFVNSLTIFSNIPLYPGYLIISNINHRNNQTLTIPYYIYPVAILNRIFIQPIFIMDNIQKTNLYWNIPGKSFMLYFHTQTIDAILISINKDNNIYEFETAQNVAVCLKCDCNYISNFSKISVRMSGVTVLIGYIIKNS